MNITQGFAFGVTETLSNTKFHALVDAAVLSDLEKAQFETDARTIQKSASAPAGPADNELWWDTVCETLRRYDSGDSKWHPVQGAKLMTNKEGAAAIRGDVVGINQSNPDAFDDKSAGDIRVIGVCAEDIADNAEGVIWFSGVRDINVTGTTAIGEFIRTSSTQFKGAPGSVKTRAIGVAVEPRTGAGAVRCLMFS